MLKSTSRALIFAIFMLAVGMAPSIGALSAPGQASVADPRVSRFGIGFSKEPGRLITEYDLNLIKIAGQFPFGWYSDWDISFAPAQPEGMEYVQLVRVGEGNFRRPSDGELAVAIANNPGMLWLIGNEPECPNQDARTPEEYAEIYHDLYYFIKDRDPTAKVAIGGVVQPSILRLRWLDRVLDEYQSRYGEALPTDIWTIHCQVLPEEPQNPNAGAGIPVGIEDTSGYMNITYQQNADLEVFKQLIRDFRIWMKAKGFQHKELFITEYGVLMPSTILVQDRPDLGDQLVIQFMLGSFDYLLGAVDPEYGCPTDGYRLVQRWLWYSLNEQPFDLSTGRGFNGSLYHHDRPNELTVFGQAFRSYALDLYGRKLYLPLGLKRFAP